MKKVSVHPQVVAAVALMAKLERQLADAKAAYVSAPAEENPLKAAEDAVLAGRDPGQIQIQSSQSARAQATLRITILKRAIDKQRRVIQQAEATAKRELIESGEFQKTHQKLLQSVADASQIFGRVCANLDRFYESLESEIGVGGSAAGHFGIPLHPGLPSDPESNFSTWIKECRRGGYTLKA